jgi:hypothetical protein
VDPTWLVERWRKRADSAFRSYLRKKRYASGLMGRIELFNLLMAVRFRAMRS